MTSVATTDRRIVEVLKVGLKPNDPGDKPGFVRLRSDSMANVRWWRIAILLLILSGLLWLAVFLPAYSVHGPRGS